MLNIRSISNFYSKLIWGRQTLTFAMLSSTMDHYKEVSDLYVLLFFSLLVFISYQTNRSFNMGFQHLIIVCSFSNPSLVHILHLRDMCRKLEEHLHVLFFSLQQHLNPFVSYNKRGDFVDSIWNKKKRSSYRKSQVALWEPRVPNCESLLIHWLKRVRTASTISSLLPYGRALLLCVTSSEKWRESSNVHIGKTRH